MCVSRERAGKESATRDRAPITSPERSSPMCPPPPIFAPTVSDERAAWEGRHVRNTPEASNRRHNRLPGDADPWTRIDLDQLIHLLGHVPFELDLRQAGEL